MEAVRAFVLAYFAAYPQPQVAALDHYISRESAYDYTIQARSGACLFQWAGARRWRVTRGGGCPPLRYQLRYADLELRSPTFRCFFSAATAPRAYQVLRYTFGRGNSC